MEVVLSTLASLVGMVEEHHNNRLENDSSSNTKSPTLSRYMIMGNSFNCLPITDYTGGRALDLESRNLDTWLHTSLAGRLWGKPLSLSSLSFFSCYNGNNIFTDYLTELWWEHSKMENTILERTIQKWKIIFIISSLTFPLPLESVLFSSDQQLRLPHFLSMVTRSMSMMEGTGITSFFT